MPSTPLRPSGTQPRGAQHVSPRILSAVRAVDVSGLSERAAKNRRLSVLRSPYGIRGQHARRYLDALDG